MTKIQMSLLLGGVCLIAACSEEPRPRSMQEFVDNPIMLEATMVRCAQDRERTRYDEECVNARQAVSQIEAREERERRTAFERQSQRKREALRRTQRAAAEARRRAADARRRREEADYLAQFGELPPGVEGASGDPSSNVPSAVIPEPREASNDAPDFGDQEPASDGGNAPVAESAPPTDLDSVREELRRRNEEAENQ